VTAPPAPSATGTHVPDNVRAHAAGRPNGAAIVGTITAAGRTGGFDLNVIRVTAGALGEPAAGSCAQQPHCSLTRLADGSWLAARRVSLEGAPGGLTYEVDLVRADGIEFVLHVSNERDPKGDSAVLSPQPPLTVDQMTAVVTSDRW
jgi:hypothetical protein